MRGGPSLPYFPPDLGLPRAHNYVQGQSLRPKSANSPLRTVARRSHATPTAGKSFAQLMDRAPPTLCFWTPPGSVAK